MTNSRICNKESKGPVYNKDNLRKKLQQIKCFDIVNKKSRDLARRYAIVKAKVYYVNVIVLQSQENPNHPVLLLSSWTLRNRRRIPRMVMVKRRHELDFGCSRWFYTIPIWYSSNISAFTLPQDLCCVWRSIHCYGTTVGVDY